MPEKVCRIESNRNFKPAQPEKRDVRYVFLEQDYKDLCALVDCTMRAVSVMFTRLRDKAHGADIANLSNNTIESWLAAQKPREGMPEEKQ